jgi:hypothetical protein
MKPVRKAFKREYRIPVEAFEKALIEMEFYKTKATPMTVHYRRADGLHVVLSSRTRKKGKPCQKVKKEIGKGKITTLKIHKDDLLTHKVIKLNASERGKFLSQLTSLTRKLRVYGSKT